MAVLAFCQPVMLSGVLTMSPVWMTIETFRALVLFTIQLVKVLYSAGLDSLKNCVSVIWIRLKPSVTGLSQFVRVDCRSET